MGGSYWGPSAIESDAEPRRHWQGDGRRSARDFEEQLRETDVHFRCECAAAVLGAERCIDVATAAATQVVARAAWLGLEDDCSEVVVAARKSYEDFATAVVSKAEIVCELLRKGVLRTAHILYAAELVALDVAAPLDVDLARDDDDDEDYKDEGDEVEVEEDDDYDEDDEEDDDEGPAVRLDTLTDDMTLVPDMCLESWAAPRQVRVVSGANPSEEVRNAAAEYDVVFAATVLWLRQRSRFVATDRAISALAVLSERWILYKVRQNFPHYGDWNRRRCAILARAHCLTHATSVGEDNSTFLRRLAALPGSVFKVVVFCL